ncbi:fungal hydrophobin [Cubamyces menziesii]|nr:fungal hydrophobin [Cubamyces menziesii]
MFARRLVAFAALAFPLLAVATPVELEARQSCSTGPPQCCDSVVDPEAASAGLLLDLVPRDITGLIGLGCSPITVVGVGSGNACSSNAVCCTNNNVGGLLSIGCVPIDL